MSEQLALLPTFLTAHLQLTLVALAAGVVISLPAGILATRVRWLEQPVLGVASVVQTVPSLALLAVMVPFLAALGLSSIGFLPAIIGLILYSLLPILRNTVTGLATVDPALIEAARGVGMTPGQRLRHVELPLALPIIMAGVRTATVLTVGVATLSTPVGAPSLGNYIFSGLQTRNFNAVLLGCVSAAVLALTLDGLIRLLALGIEQRRRLWLASAVVALGALCAVAGAGVVRSAVSGHPASIRIGAKTFTEQYILSEILAGQIRRSTSLSAESVQSLGSTVAFDALRTDQIDVYVDYSGTLWATILKREVGPDRQHVLEEVGRVLREDFGVIQVGSLGFENAYALAMRRRHAAQLGVQRISALASVSRQLSFGADYEFLARPEWKALRERYGLEFAVQRSMDSSLMYQAVAAGQVDVISAFTTDGRIQAFDLVLLDDDRQAIPPYDAVILVSPRIARERPEVVQALAALVGSIDDDRMRQMNHAVDDRGDPPAEVARRFLQSLWNGSAN